MVKRIKTKAKGDRTYRKCRALLEAEGYWCEKVERVSRFKKDDLFGLFDLVAIKPAEWRLIQLKTNNKPNLQAFQQFYDKYALDGMSVEVWVWYDRVGFKIHYAL